MDFGDLTSYKTIDQYFTVLCQQSKQQILQELFCDKKQITQQKSSLQNEISQAFCYLFTHFSPHPTGIATRISNLFNINLETLSSTQPSLRPTYIRDCISRTIQKQLALSEQSHVGQKRKYTPIEVAKNDRNTKHAFGWIELKTKYKYLKATFEEILLEKVREFDEELGEMVRSKVSGNGTKVRVQRRKMGNTLNTMADEDTLADSQPPETLRTATRPKSVTQLHSSRFCKIPPPKRLNPQQPQVNFSNVAIRDTTKFTLKRWGKTQQHQFRSKKQIIRNTFHKTSNIPVIFQFVKKYTQTTKARDHLMQRWHNKSDLKEEELRYLCATSVFLNQTINNSEKQNIKDKISTLNRDMLSKLEFNIAEKIIETYREFTTKVANLRANYYLSLTKQTKEMQKEKAEESEKHMLQERRYREYLVYLSRFQKICGSPSMRYRLDYRVMRWVRYFIEKLKGKIGVEGRSPRLRKMNSTLTMSRLYRMHSTHPSSRVTKPPNPNDPPNPNAKSSHPSTVATSQFNSLKYKNKIAFVKHISGGPKRLATSLVKVDLFNKTAKCDASALQLIIYIQACWRRAIAMRNFKKQLKKLRQKRQQQFQLSLKRLKYFYPTGMRIIYQYILKRLKKTNRHTNAVLSPYPKPQVPPTSKFTHFYRNSQLSQKMLQIKYQSQTQNKLAVKVNILHDCAMKNQFDRIMASGFVLTQRQLNQLVNDKTALHWTTKNNNLEFTKFLLSGGGDPNAADREGNTPLFNAFVNQNFSVVFALIEYGGDLNQVNALGHTPLFYATREFLGQLGLENGVVSGKERMGDNNMLYYRMFSEIEDPAL